eukprot:gene25897-11570_t
MIASVLAVCIVAAVAMTASAQDGPYIQTLDNFPGYKTTFRTGDKTPTYPMAVGTTYDKDMNPIVVNGENVVSNNPDFHSIHVTPGGNVYSLTQFESPNPAGFIVTKLDQDKDDGSLTPVWHKPVDWSAEGGLWIPCAGSITSTGSHAGGEEYEPDAMCLGTAESLEDLKKCVGGMGKWEGMFQYLGMPLNYTLEDIKENFKYPYHYGHAFEVTLNGEDGDVTVAKHYAMGRHSYELWMVMPDNVTAYSTDDGSSTAFWKFVADAPNNFSSGILYGAKFYQQSADYGGDFIISWIPLAHGNQAEIKAMLAAGITFTDIFDFEMADETQCPEGYRIISPRDNAMKGAECLKLKSGMEKAATFLESRRFLAYLGGTVEMTKFEGITYDPITGKLYAAMSQVRYSMEDFKHKGSSSTAWDIGGTNNVRVPYNPCGCIYAIDLSPDMNAIRMYGEVCGVYQSEAHGRSLGVCDVAGISEPDNVIVLPGQATLIIGEDTGTVEHDSLWEYDLRTKTLKRIFSTPYGAETTSPYWYDDINDWSYLTAAIQHPYGESAREKANDPGSLGLAGWVGAWAFKTSELNEKNGSLEFEAIPPPYLDAEKHQVRAYAAAYIRTLVPYADVAGSE